jgi:hypothetical protein
LTSPASLSTTLLSALAAAALLPAPLAALSLLTALILIGHLVSRFVFCVAGMANG